MEEFFEVKKVFSHNKTERGLAFHCIASTQLKDFKVVTNSGKTNNLVIEVNLINTNVVQLRMIPWDFYYKKQSDIVKVTNVPSFFCARRFYHSYGAGNKLCGRKKTRSFNAGYLSPRESRIYSL